MTEEGLREELRDLITQEGPISIARYMSLCLGHPRFGYYVKQDPFGRAGDFVTAPEISQMFGELIGLWVVSLWDQMGRPARIALVELGPGRGTLMADLLRAAKALPPFLDAVEVHLIEMSPVLRQAQKQKLAPSGIKIHWHRFISDLPEGVAKIIVANEFFDALPIRQIMRTERGWHERLVGLDDAGMLTFGLASEAYPLDQPAPEGHIVEICPEGQQVMRMVAGMLAAHGGALLAIDYGYASGSGDSLQAMRAHRFVDPLAEPGDADLTAHVDFQALAQTARDAGAKVHPLLSQAAFLRRLGLDMRANRLKAGAPDQAAVIDAAVKRLSGTSDKDMGLLFKALCVTGGPTRVPPVFENADPLIERQVP